MGRGDAWLDFPASNPAGTSHYISLETGRRGDLVPSGWSARRPHIMGQGPWEPMSICTCLLSVPVCSEHPMPRETFSSSFPPS